MHSPVWSSGESNFDLPIGGPHDFRDATALSTRPNGYADMYRYHVEHNLQILP